MKLDQDIKEMSFSERGQELARLRALIRTHKKAENNARCWHNDVTLYEKSLPEGAEGVGKMTMPKEALLRNCEVYISRQQCTK